MKSMENIMKRVILSGLAVIALALGVCVTAVAQSQPQPETQSLGDYARTLKKNKSQATKPAGTVYDNDNLPSTTSLSVVGANSDSTGAAASTPAANTAQQQNGDDPSKVKAGQSVENRQKAYDSWKQKIDAQKQKIDQLAHDLDDAKNKPQPTVAVWPYNTDYQKGVDEKQKALDEARAQLDQMQEDARKQGVPSSVAQ
jgi:hypothetical protein